MFYYAVDKTLMPKLKSFLLHFCRHSPKADVNCFFSQQLYGTVSWQNRMVCILIPPVYWYMFRFKIHFHFPSKEILIIFSFIHTIFSFTQEFIAAFNRFFFFSQYFFRFLSWFCYLPKNCSTSLSSTYNDGIFHPFDPRRRKEVREI